MLNGAKVLVVDDELSMREFLEILLTRQGCALTMASDGKDAIERIDTHAFDLIISDLKMPEVTGLDVLHHAKKKQPEAEVILVTAFATAETALKAIREGAYDYLTKPFKVEEILATLERAYEKRSLVRDNLNLRNQLKSTFKLDRLIGRSRHMQQVFELIRKVASSKTSILISGESGTGKELVARAIHSTGDRSNAPFVAVNCGAIPDTLMESELFGHEKGAFTGASQPKDGLFIAANKGTIFLDEIGELAPAMQVKLLRVLQERKVKPVGSTKEKDIDVRVITATNRDLDEEIEAQRFRPDLFYRLNVIPIAIPPLRDRRTDIPLLIEHFLMQFSAQSGQPKPEITPEALSLLSQYHYPGNVRELENLVERAFTLSTENRIDAQSLPELTKIPEQDCKNDDLLPETGIDLDKYLSAIEKRYILHAIKKTNGNRTEAARFLGMSTRSIRYRLSKFGLESDDSN